ncbi:NADH-quinone oxidoreductase subunit G [Anaerobacterium chartisolvens]|uniref:NADH-quinone oxidoreductase subunit G n=1 Tax=Anaerobacterium chartisolvens TaxID=1297424 RepID=A0A369AQ96_9FIRM|nr:[FeFe] hydrogenase, group A [Anaerobacterium chartisolvens]RCX09634.1 NADH-quinone oxidoreductase subunit G [Anaerobacterium chartisolvens]
MGQMLVDGQRIEFSDEKNILQVIRKAGIELPTFCYHSELSIYGACRMCVVEDKWGGISASCSTPPKNGMEVYTNTPKLQKHRKMILELLLSAHDRDCTSCEKNGRCKLQELAIRFGIKNIRFGEREENLPIDDSSCAIVRNPNKCIMCGDCVRMCEEVQGIGALGFAYRGSNIQVVPAFKKKLKDVDCVNCGQCRTVCPTGALIIRNDTAKVWKDLNNKKKRVVAQIAPAVRVSIGEEFGMAPGEITIGKIAAALRKLGFDEVYDTGIAADLTVIEESKEFIERLEKGERLPLFTSCCPGWVRYAELKFPELKDNISTCRSPQQMFGAVIKEHYKKSDAEDGRETISVAIMPCTAKKYEAGREEYSNNGVKDVDVVITTQELCLMIKQAGIMFGRLEEEALDMPFGLASGAGIIFGVSGGVSEAVLRRCYSQKTSSTLKEISFVGVRGMDGIKETVVNINGKEIKMAIVSGLKNAGELIKAIQKGEKNYDFVEVMACPGGCIAGAGQPLPSSKSVTRQRAGGIYKADSSSQIKRSEENPMVIALYNGLLKGKHGLLHNHCACNSHSNEKES